MKKSDDQLVLIAPDRRRHAEAIYDLSGRVYGFPGYFDYIRRARRSWGGGIYDWAASTVGFLGREMVTHWGAWGYTIRVGSARLRVAGVGQVFTHGFHRKEGLMSRTVAAAIPRMRECGYDISILFGIPDYYHRFGYVPAWEPAAYVVETRWLPKEPPSRPVRQAPVRMTAEMDALYNRGSVRLACTAVRPAQRICEPWVQGRSLYAWRDPRGRLEGHAVVQVEPGKVVLIDSSGDPEEVLRFLARLARGAGATEVRFPDQHWDSALARRLRTGFCRLELRFSRSGGPMIRTLNLASSLRTLCPEFSRLLRRSELGGWRGMLRIEDAWEAVTLAIGRGRVAVAGEKATRHVLRGGEYVAQFLIGTHGPEQVMADGRMKASGDAAALARVLFPARNPVLAPWDQY
jgi:predicted N-acetyltransferase YhbS